MDIEEDLEKWCQMYVLYLTGTVICPTSNQQASMKYASLLSSDALGELIEYDWCGHVLKHMHDGLVDAQTKKSLNVDLHLIMICMCEKFGNVPSRSVEVIPLCGEWRTSNAKKEWETIEAKTISCKPLGKEIEFPAFRPGTKIDLEGLNDNDIGRLKEWILGIRASCDAQLSFLNEFVRAKQVPTADTPDTSSPGVGGIGSNMADSAVKEGGTAVQDPITPSVAPSVGAKRRKEVCVRRSPTKTYKTGGVHTTSKGKEVPVPPVVVERIKKPSAAVVSPYTAERKRNGGDRAFEVRSSATVVLPLEDDLTEEIEIQLIALKEYFLGEKDADDKMVVDYGKPDFQLRRFQLTEFLKRAKVSSNLIDCYGYYLNRMEAESGVIKRWIFPVSVATTVHKNINSDCLEEGSYGEEATDIIHSPDWMSRFKDITDCEFWFLPILHGEHYRMIIVDIKQKRFQFFDSKSTADFESRWQETGARVVLYIKEYYAKFKSQVDFKKFKWETIKGITQRSGTESCGDYILRMMVSWMGKVETWMHKKWRDEKEIDQLREQITLDVFSTSWNTQFKAVMEAGLIHYTVGASQLPLPS
ncbi:hypothetical protein LINPERHAP2_LOCUS15558 [Linum perenne]